jgi:hypothetical protein
MAEPRCATSPALYHFKGLRLNRLKTKQSQIQTSREYESNPQNIPELEYTNSGTTTYNPAITKAKARGHEGPSNLYNKSGQNRNK